jgi:hypothetical protein
MMVLAGALALSAVASASASAALPEMVNKEGKALVKSKFTGASSRLEWVWQKEGGVECAYGAKSSGEVTGLQSSHMKWTWTGCDTNGEGWQTEGAKKGEIVIPELKSQLVYEVYEKGAKLEPAILLTLAKEIKLGNILQEYKIKGSLLVPMPPGEELRTHFSIEARQSGGKQEGTGEYEETRGGEVKKASLTTTATGAKSFKEEPTALAFAEERKFEEEFKINW